MLYRAGNSFPPSCRLHNRKEFDLLWKSGHKYHARHFLIIVMQRNSGPTRLGLTVSRKIGGAVARNRVKRLLREYFRLTYDHLPSSVDLVIVAKKGAAALSFAEVSRELEINWALQLAQRTSCLKK